MATSRLDPDVMPGGVKGRMAAACKQQDESRAANRIERSINQQSPLLHDRLSRSSLKCDGRDLSVLFSKTPNGGAVKLMFNRPGFADRKWVSNTLMPPYASAPAFMLVAGKHPHGTGTGRCQEWLIAVFSHGNGWSHPAKAWGSFG